MYFEYFGYIYIYIYICVCVCVCVCVWIKYDRPINFTVFWKHLANKNITNTIPATEVIF